MLDALRNYGRTRSAAMLFITHDLAVAYSLCDRAIVLAAGKVVEQGSMADLLARPGDPYTRALVASATVSSSVAAWTSP